MNFLKVFHWKTRTKHSHTISIIPKMSHVIIYIDVVDVDNKLNELCNAQNLYVKYASLD